MHQTVVQGWLQEAGLGQYMGAFAAISPADFTGLLMQQYHLYGVNDLGDKQKLFRLIKSLQGREAEQTAPQITNTLAQVHLDQPQSDLFNLEDADSELLSDYAYGMDVAASPRTLLGAVSTSKPAKPISTKPTTLEQMIAREQIDPNPPKIRVVVRKRPVNHKEVEKDDEDIVQVDMGQNMLMVNEPKVKVDLTKYTERHVFAFDAALNEDVTNDQVYRSTVQPLVTTLFRGGKATCFAYGQTGSGKTFTMRPLPLRAAEDIFLLLGNYEELNLYVSCFEIYGGKLYDLLNTRKRLDIREDAKRNVCIVGLEEFQVSTINDIADLVELSSQHRSTGSTGANADSSRSHSIMQFALKKDMGPKQPTRLVGKLSFIDLAGSERGADTYDNDKQTRLEGAEINKSLLALKECIRALDSEARHIPFRGSKLTEVLRDSFVGTEARTVMIANVSPTSSSCEHTLNTLRYADRVKELRKSTRSGSTTSSITGGPTLASGTGSDTGLATLGSGTMVLRTVSDSIAQQQPQQAPVQSPYKRRNSHQPSSGHGGGLNLKNAWGGYEAQQRQQLLQQRSEASTYSQDSGPPIQTTGSGLGGAVLGTVPEQHIPTSAAAPPSPAAAPVNGNAAMNGNGVVGHGRGASNDSQDNLESLLQFEDELVLQHRKHIEEVMGWIRDEMALLGEVDKPGSSIEEYIEQLGLILQQKADAVAVLQHRLSQYQQLLLSRSN